MVVLRQEARPERVGSSVREAAPPKAWGARGSEVQAQPEVSCKRVAAP
jgi:hypothetical protein